jgi:SNF2 family DNA or RNA helicase
MLKRKPREKQAEALSLISGKKAFALFMEMRTGKTKVIIDDWQRRPDCPDLLVIAPASVYRVWGQALHDDAVEMPLVYTWVSSERADVTPFLKHKGCRVLLMNVETLSSVEDAQNLCVDFMEQRRKVMLVIDESTIIKSHSAKRTQFITLSLAPRAAYRRILSGLPTPRSPFDLYAQMYFLDPAILNYPNYFVFRKRYAILKKIPVGNRSVEIVVGYRNTEELQRKIAPHSFRVLLSECTDLPTSTYMVREVKLTDEQKRVYKDLKKHATAELESSDHVTAGMVIVQILRMHQVLMGRAVDENDVTHDLGEHRIATLLELLNETSEKAVIFCSYVADVQKITASIIKEFGEGSAARFWGGYETREVEEARFKTDANCRFMVATAAAGGLGRTWDCASMEVFYSSTNNLEHRMQAESRTLAVGKTQSMLYVDLIVPGTVEEEILNALRNKIDMATAITGDNYREWLV